MLSCDVSRGIDEFKVLSMVRDRLISLTMRDQFHVFDYQFHVFD